MSSSDRKNIYEMYVDNGNRCGFWVKRESWSRNIARITSVNGKFEGLLTGVPPYFKNPKVRGDVYLEDSGEMYWNMGGSGKNQEITGAGTYRYSPVGMPAWWKEK